ncbi:MAG TPA: FAD/NAD(P)-binding protein [Candidatus Krumholzibacteria bacterium]|nr:FAD/NAD(P)-binding protein [Candidatus Krumholzibacteria bacterium]
MSLVGVSTRMPTIAVVGAGFSGVATAANLARLPWPRGVRIVLLERGPRFARGVAYSTDHPLHLLNVPAGRMGALADDEGHFLRWLNRTEPTIKGDTFVPRRRYGEYLEWLLDDATARAASNVEIVRRAGDVVDVVVSDARATVKLRDGESIDADRVVLALGNLPPRDPFASVLESDARYARDPWAPGALASLPRTRNPVLLVGSGLTMVDAVLALRDAGHDSGFIAVSRHGMLPHSHRDWPAKPPVVEPPRALEDWDGSAGSIVRMVRVSSRDARRSGLDWRDVINGLRPITPQLWHRMPPRERARFVRHVRPFWETHRHRMSTRVAEEINGLIARGELAIVAGRVAEASTGAQSITVTVRLRGSAATARYETGAVVNCTGPDGDFARLREPLVAALRERGVLVPDALGLGLVADANGALIDAQGRASSVLFTLGTPRRADAWESTAVPELRAQAERLSHRLRESLP